MSALRKAGVWLGLVEDEDDRAYDDRDRTYGKTSYRDGYRGRYGGEFADDEEVDVEEAAAGRARAERTARIEAARAERASVRSITRPASPEPASSVVYATRENLALAPQVQLRERAVVADDGQRYQITTLHPTTYREARTIGEHFRDGVPVIINLTEMEEADARRLVDFAAGLAFGLRGTIERVTNRVFLLSPANVQVTAEDKARIAEGGFFDQS
ncbi:MAG TPA: cell division protein SepF [Micromonosporaceae bacterium]|jgi:cell division inhibitor SepF